MKLLLLLFVTLLLNADEFPFIKPISVERAPMSATQTSKEVTQIMQEEPAPQIKAELQTEPKPLPQETTPLVIPEVAIQASIPEDENKTTQEEPLAVNDENLSKKDVSNELVKTKVLKITFKPSRAVITADSQPQIVKFADYLQKNKALQVVIYGYTDSVGSAHTNLKLSQKRAKSVTKALNALGVSTTRLTAVGMGEKDPVASNKTPEGRAQNRRIEALIIE